jgi:hypothetical protein
MKYSKSANDGEEGTKVLVFSACALEEGVEWVDEGFSVENSLLTTKLSKFITHLDLYVGKLGLLDNHHVIDRFDKNGSAWVNVYNVKEALNKYPHEAETIQTYSVFP